MSKHIALFIPGNPVPQGRPKFARQGNFVRCYDPKKSSEWKQFISLRAASENVQPFSQGTALEISAVFYLTRPVSVSVKKRPYPTSKPDLDNLIKALKDGLKGITWHDDSQVVKISAVKQYSDKPGIYIEVVEFTG